MKTVRIEEFRGHAGEEVLVRGWIHNKRSSGQAAVPDRPRRVGLRAGGRLEEGGPARGLGRAREGGAGVLDRAHGARCGRTSARPGGYEVDVTSATVLQAVHDYPITPKDHGTAFLMENRHLWLRSTRQHAIARVRHTVVKAVRDYLDDQGYILVDTPIFTPAACEGTTTLFGVPYFDEGTAYLTQSGQLYNEATAAAHGKVYCFGPTFRAEKSKTRRHLTEFWMVEPEIAFAHLDDAVALAEGLVCYVVAQALEKRREELKVLERDTAKLESVKAPFPRLHYDDAMKLLHAKGSETPMGSDFGGTDETVIAGEYDRPVVVHRFPSAIKAFYMAPDPEAPEYSLSADILAPEGYGEIVGGGERLADHELLLQRIREHELPEEAFRVVPRPAASTGASRTRASAWASSAWSPGSAASTTCARRSPSRGCCTGSILDVGGAAPHPPRPARFAGVNPAALAARCPSPLRRARATPPARFAGVNPAALAARCLSPLRRARATPPARFAGVNPAALAARCPWPLRRARATPPARFAGVNPATLAAAAAGGGGARACRC